MKSILDKEAAYNCRFDAIRTRMFAVLADLDPESIRRGRHGHSCAKVQRDDVTVIIDIQMERVGWDNMPDVLADDHPIELWVSAHRSSDRTYVSTDEIHWELPFCQLADNLDEFLAFAKKFLVTCDSDSFTSRNRLSSNPDRIPNLNGARPGRFA
jgi:hypothetical protein